MHYNLEHNKYLKHNRLTTATSQAMTSAVCEGRRQKLFGELASFPPGKILKLMNPLDKITKDSRIAIQKSDPSPFFM